MTASAAAARILVVGAGATGAYFGALAARGGAEVTFVARGPHGAAMREHGVRVRDASGEWAQAVSRVVASVAELDASERFDVVLVMVKMHDLQAVLPRCAALCAEGGAVVLGQNGVDAEAEATAAGVAAETLVGAVLIISASVPEPGAVQVGGMVRMLLGAPAEAGAAAAKAAAERLAAGGVPAGFAPDLAAVKWSKLIWNNAWNVITCLTGLTVAAAARQPELRALGVAAMRETAAVARAEGVKLPDGIVEVCLAQADAIGETQTSMLQDRLAGRPLEVEALCGTVVRRGRERGVAVPVNEVHYALLRGVDAGRACKP